MKKGFTLIELLVAISLFSVVVAIAVGGFARALHTEHEVEALITTQSNAGITLEQMAREARTGYRFCVLADGSTPNSACSCALSPGNSSELTCSTLAFDNAAGDAVQYSLSNGLLLKNGQSITGDNVDVKYLTFVLSGNVQGDHWNPRITISMGITPSSTDPALQSNELDLETTVSARQADASSTY